MKLIRRVVIAAALACAFASAYGAWEFFMKQKGHIDDDDFYFLYGTAGALTAPKTYRELTDTFVAAQRQMGYPKRFVDSLELRKNYVFNYAAPSVVYLATIRARQVWDRLAMGQDATGGPLEPWRLRQGFLAAFLAAFGFVSWLVWTSDDPLIALAWAATVVILGYWATTVSEGSDQRFAYLWVEHPSQVWTHIQTFFRNPRWYSLLHNSPRSTFVIVLVGVFILRWTNRLVASYWCLLLAVMTHGSNGLMMTAFIVLIDAVSNPGFYTTAVLRPAALSLLAAVAAESVWPAVLLGGGLGVRLAVVAGLIAGVALVWRRAAAADTDGQMVLAAYRRTVVAAVARVGRVPMDLLLLGAIWIILFAISVPMTTSSTSHLLIFFYPQANGRMLALIQPLVVLGPLIWLLWQAVPRRPGLPEAVALVLLVPLTLVSWQTLTRGLNEPDGLLKDMQLRVPTLEAQVQAPPMENRVGQMEDDYLQLYVDYLFYYALARSMESGSDLVSPLVTPALPASPPAVPKDTR